MVAAPALPEMAQPEYSHFQNGPLHWHQNISLCLQHPADPDIND